METGAPPGYSANVGKVYILTVGSGQATGNGQTTETGQFANHELGKTANDGSVLGQFTAKPEEDKDLVTVFLDWMTENSDNDTTSDS